MRLQQLQCILEVQKHHSISAAARAMYMGQTTVSACIRKLEEELGVSIFERSTNGVEPTEEGRQVLELAQEICWNYARLQDIGQEKAPASPATIHVSPSVEAFLPDLLADRLSEQEIPVRFRIQRERRSAISQHIINNKCDIAVTYTNPSGQEQLMKITEKYGIQVKKLAVDHFYLVVRQDHPLAGRTEMPVQEVQDLEIAGLQHYRENAQSLVFEPRMGYTNRYTTLPSAHLILRTVKEQNMAGILNGFAVAYENSRLGKDFCLIRLTDPERDNKKILTLIYRNSWAQTQNGKVLLEHIQQSLSDLLSSPSIARLQMDSAAHLSGIQEESTHK